MKNIVKIVVLGCSLMLLVGCSPKEGSVGWCEDMDKKAKGDWTTNDMKIYAENCVFRKSE